MAFPSAVSFARALRVAPVTLLMGGACLLVNPGTAHAALCNTDPDPDNLTAYNVGQLNAAGFSCVIGDKEYSDFVFTDISSGSYTFTTDGTDHTFSGSGLNFSGASFTYSYTVTLFNAVPGQEFVSFNTGVATSSNNANQVFSKSLTTVPPNPAVVPGTSTNSRNGLTIIPGNVVPFGANETGPIRFTSTVTRSAGRVDIITDSITQKFAPPTSDTPSPLPILGAGAAFGLSRKLRQRIRQTA